LQVVAVGPGAMGKDGKVLPMNVAVGDRVLLPEYGGHTVTVDAQEMHLYRDEDIIAKLQ
jgi:chaperonin GroES